LLTFLAAQGVPKLISKNDRPRFVDQEVEIYEDRALLPGDLQSQCGFPGLTWPQKSDSRIVVEQEVQPRSQPAINHVCDYRDSLHIYILRM